MKPQKNKLIIFLFVSIILVCLIISTILGLLSRSNSKEEYIDNQINDETINEVLEENTESILEIATPEPIDILPEEEEQYEEILFKDGMADEKTREIFKEDIDKVRESIKSDSIDVLRMYIQILYYDLDLNADGYLDRIVVISSSSHNGNHGDLFRIYENNEDGSYVEIGGGFLHIAHNYFTELDHTKVYISHSIKNGYKKIKVVYRNGAYNLLYFRDVSYTHDGLYEDGELKREGVG